MLRPQIPLVAQAVMLSGSVQQVDRALYAVEGTPTGQSERPIANKDMGKLVSDYHDLHRRSWRY